MSKDYTLQLNSYGNVNGIPQGWYSVPQTVTQLRAAKIPNYKSCLGFNENHGYYKPILVNIIPKNYKCVLTKWLNGRKKPKAQTQQDKILAWCKRLSKLTGCSMDDATQIANQKLEYQELKIAEMEDRQQDRGYSVKREKLINAMYRANPLRRIIDVAHAEAIMQAHKRHTETNYDAMLYEAHELIEQGELCRDEAKEYARLNCKPKTLIEE